MARGWLLWQKLVTRQSPVPRAAAWKFVLIKVGFPTLHEISCRILNLLKILRIFTKFCDYNKKSRHFVTLILKKNAKNPQQI